MYLFISQKAFEYLMVVHSNSLVRYPPFYTMSCLSLPTVTVNLICGQKNRKIAAVKLKDCYLIDY